jgi:L-threonylcarbamoyladenylate synthase
VPLIAASRSQIEACCGALGEAETRLAEQFWPGPLSLVLPAPDEVDPAVHGGAGTIAVRVPALSIARDLADVVGYLVTATSANQTGAPPAVRTADLDGLAADPRVLIIDGGSTLGGLPSTIVDLRRAEPTLVRDGPIGWNRVLESLRQ